MLILISDYVINVESLVSMKDQTDHARLSNMYKTIMLFTITPKMQIKRNKNVTTKWTQSSLFKLKHNKKNNLKNFARNRDRLHELFKNLSIFKKVCIIVQLIRPFHSIIVMILLTSHQYGSTEEKKNILGRFRDFQQIENKEEV